MNFRKTLKELKRVKRVQHNRWKAKEAGMKKRKKKKPAPSKPDNTNYDVDPQVWLRRDTNRFKHVQDEHYPSMRKSVEPARPGKVKKAMYEMEIKEAMHKNLKINPSIEWLKPMTLERSTYKTKFIEKTYEE